MASIGERAKVITSASPHEYFQKTIHQALHEQRVEADNDTVAYLVFLLVDFIRAERLFERTPDGLRIRPLALHYERVLSSRSERERHAALRRLGDVALFIAGLFADSLERKLVDIDYYIAMGGSAYGFLASNPPPRALGGGVARVFQELSDKFTDFVDVLGEVGDRSNLKQDANVLRLYEVWLRSGSKRAERRLRALGIEPFEAPHGTRH